MHQIEGGIDLFQWHGMGHQAIELDGAIHVLIDHARQFGASLDTTKRSADPAPTDNQVERTCLDFFTRTGDTDNG